MKKIEHWQVIAMLLMLYDFVAVMTAFVERMPVSYYIIGIMCQFSLTLGIRFSYRFILLLRGRKNKNAHEKKVMLIGAGAAGQMIFRDIKGAKETNERVVCFIDDNSNKWDRYIDGVPVFGGRDRILEAVEVFGVEKIYVAVSIGGLLMTAIYYQIESHFLINRNPFFYCALPALIIGLCAGHRLFISSIECNIQSSVKDCVFFYKKSLFVGKSEDCSS